MKTQIKDINHCFISVVFIVLLLIITSCETIFMAPTPSKKPTAIFAEYASLVKTKYAMLDNKGVNIDQLKSTLEQKVNDDMSDEALFNVLGEITLALKDPHSVLTIDKSNPNSKRKTFNLLQRYPSGFNYNEILYPNYLKHDVEPPENRFLDKTYFINGKTYVADYKMIYGHLAQHPDLIYCWIPTWKTDISPQQIASFFATIQNSKGLILDLRNNTGGSPNLVLQFASHFIDQRRYTGFERFKIGPNENDFKDSPIYLEPAQSSNKYLKPVMILTNRLVYSASTTFIYLLSYIDRIKTVGQRTGGGSGSVSDGFLANGWYWSLSISEFIDQKGQRLDSGVDPDIPQVLNLQDKTKDEVIERAITELNKVISNN